MGTAYTPGLKVSARTHILKMRRLPLKGDVLVKEGDRVLPDTVVARTQLPGLLQTVKLAERMSIEPGDIVEALLVKKGDRVERGDIIARTKGILGRFFKSEFKSPVAGFVELINTTSGHVGIREAPLPIERTAYITGRVSRVLPGEGVEIACEGALIQGIFGVGGERRGELAMAVAAETAPLTDRDITEAHRGKIVVGGSNVSSAALRKAASVGAAGIVVGGVIDLDLMGYLAEALQSPGYDIGVAITGQESIPFSLIITEGFGSIAMARRTFDLLKSLEGKTASINGATQIRAGVIRPEVIVPSGAEVPSDAPPAPLASLGIGTPIRVIREPYFGILGKVTALPNELVKVDSETMVRVLDAELADGRAVVVPRANVEIMETA